MRLRDVFAGAARAARRARSASRLPALGVAALFTLAPDLAGAQQALPAIVIRVAPRGAGAHAKVAQPRPGPRRPLPAIASAPGPALPPIALRDDRPIAADGFGSTLVVSQEALRRLPSATLGDLLFDKPGVTGSSYAPGAASRPVVRGLDNYRVRIQENGLAASGVSELGEDHGVPLDPLGANRVEVIHGPATLRWGAAAMGGVVTVENNRIPDHPPCEDAALRESGCASAETRAAASTVDGALENATLLDAGRGAFLFHADIAGRRASDYAIPGYPYLFPPDPPPPVHGRQPNSAMRMGSAALGGTYLFDAGYVGFSVTQFSSLYHIPGLEPAQTDTRIDMRQTRIASKGEARPRGGLVDTVRFWVGLSNYRHNELGLADGVDGVQQTFANQELETRVETLLQPVALPVGTLKTSFGFQGAHQSLSAPGAEGALFDPNRTKSVAGFLFNELIFNPAQRLQLAGRVEHAQILGATPDFAIDPGFSLLRGRAFTPMSGALGFLQDLPGDMVASLTAQYVERAPRAPELFSRGPHDATGTFDVGDPNLGIEGAKTAELSLRRAPGPLRFEANLYYTRFDRFIFRNLTGESCGTTFSSCGPSGSGGDLAQAFYAQRNAVFRGVEFQSQLDLAPLAGGTLGLESQFDVVRASFTGGGNAPRMPPARLGGGLLWRDANWLARINLLHAFAQNAIAATGETPTKGYDLLKAELSYKMILAPQGGPLGKEMTLGVVGNNLLDANIRNSVSYRKNEVLLSGANLRIFATILF